MTTALLVVDVQKDYLLRDGLSPDREAFQSALGDLLASVRERGWPVIHVRTRVSQDGSDAMPHWHETQVSCIEGTVGAEPPAALEALPSEAVFFKRYYSAFEDPSLLTALRAANIDTVIVAGLYTHACVRSAVLDAYAHGFNVFVPNDAVASYDEAHAKMTLQWLHGRAANCLPAAEILSALSDPTPASLPQLQVWLHRNPSDWTEVLSEVALARESEITATVTRVAHSQRGWDELGQAERAQRLSAWRKRLAAQEKDWVNRLIREVGKPRIDAEGEVRYGLALLEFVCSQLREDPQREDNRVRYRPHGLVGLITPWNNPFAIPIGKIAPALGYGNGVLWKPALPASGLSLALYETLAHEGLSDAIGLLTGDAITGQLLVSARHIEAISFTGSITAGRQVVRLCSNFSRPLQAELGGNNAAIVLGDADVEAVAQDLATAMFSFAGQRCTAIRRVIVERSILESFSAALCAAVSALNVGFPEDVRTQVGPVISREIQTSLLASVQNAVASGGRVLIGGRVPPHCSSNGCWLEPTVISDASLEAPVFKDELFGPVVVLVPAKDLEEALILHNGVQHGLLGALFSSNKTSQIQFLAQAKAGILVINQARPAFASSGPFTGWKASGYGVPEHGRWNRDFYTKVQAVYAQQ